MSEHAVQFVLNGENIRLENVSATTTLLDYLREEQRLRGTKEGCAEGDCGACTVLIGRLQNGLLIYETVNSCIRFLASLHACHIVTIEHLRGYDGALHPVQQAMVDHHGSQCGFCTPGIVMSLYALWMQNPSPSREDIEIALQGNLCRCTGYEPIIKAALAASSVTDQSKDPLYEEREMMIAKLRTLQIDQRIVSGPKDNCAIIPSNVDDLMECLQEYKGSTIVAGSSDVGLWVTKHLKSISPAIFISHLEELREMEETEDSLIINSGVSYSDSLEFLANTFPFLKAYWHRIAGWQIRNMGTVGGNIANGSPIGDTAPILIALGAKITLQTMNATREIPLEDFFIAYGKQDLHEGEFLKKIEIPKPKSGTLHTAYKISKRKDEDISTVAVGIAMERVDSKISNPRLAFGGMAATPKRASRAEAVLHGAVWEHATFEAAAEALAQDFQPLSDMRATAEYRLLTAQNLLRRFFLEHDGEQTFPISLSAVN